MENGSVKKTHSKKSPEELFNKFVEAQDCPEILQTFQRLVNVVGVVAETPREFYQSLKSKLQSWKCKSLWELLDNRANQNEYLKGSVCEDIHALVIGCGPIGLRTAIELALLGAQVVIVEKRKNFSRNNVLHLWPFLLSDFRSLGAKKFYGKFCSGAIDHISIRRLQAILLKSALLVGVKVFTGVTFDKVIEPIDEDSGWKCQVTPYNEGLSDYEVDVIIGADGKKNVLPWFEQIEMRGTLAIGITANFVNHYTEDEKGVEEISGIAYQFNPGFFDRLKQQKGVQLENIVYYKDETHYFVMTAVKSSLLKRGVLKKDHNKPQNLLNPENVDQEKLVSYVNDAVQYATKGQLTNLEFKRDDNGKADIAAFDFTSIKKAENSARIIERKGHKLLLGLVGDSLLEPFWPTGSGCARGVLTALDAAWMVRSFAQDKPPLQILSERENIYRLLSGTSTENMQKNHASYTINPSSRYTHIPQKKIQEVYHLYDTDDPVNADFSLGSPTGVLASKVVKKKRVSSTPLKPHYRSNRKHIRFATSPTFDSPYSSSGSSIEDLTPQGARKRQKIDVTGRQRTVSETLTSGGEEVHEITATGSKGGKKTNRGTKNVKSPTSALNITRSVDSRGKIKSKKHKLTVDRTVSASPVSARKEKAHKRRSFFLFGRARSKSRTGKKSPRNVEKVKEVIEEEIRSTAQSQVESSSDDILSKDESYQREVNRFSRNHPTRRSARDIIAEIEARNNNTTSQVTHRKNSAYDRSLREITGNKASIKRATSDSNIYTTPTNTQTKTDDIWKEIESMSPVAKAAVPALVKMSPDYQKENDINAAHSGVHDLSSAMRIAGLMAMATPLLASTGRKQESAKDIPWYSRNAGRVKDTINKYDSLNGRRYLAKDGTPLRPPNDSVDSDDRKPTLVEVAERIMRQQKTSGSHRDHKRPVSWHPTAISVVEGKTDIKTISDQAIISARQQELEKLRVLGIELSKLDEESTDSPVKKNFASGIYQKTFIAELNKAENDSKTAPKINDDTADLNERARSNDVIDGDAADLKTSSSMKDVTVDNSDGTAVPKEGRLQTPKKQNSVPRNYAMEGEWRKSPALAKKEMERVMLNLTETMSRDRAMTSIKFLISMYRRIQRNPKEDKFRRIFKSRVKFKKYVWTVRNAKMFLLASGWMEVGSFLLFPVEKNVREPLAILNKFLGSLEDGSTVQISTIKSTPRRQANCTRNTQTPSTKTGINETPKTTRNPSTTSTSSNETPVKSPANITKQTPTMDKRFSRSVPMNLNNWDLEMEDPLEQVSIKQSDKKSSLRRRLVSSALEHTTPRSPVTPDIAIMEEIDELSNTLDDLMETMKDVEKPNETKIPSAKSHSNEIQDLCTTLDYLLDSSEEEVLDRDLKTFKTSEHKKDVVTYVKTSAFSRVPSSKRRQLPSTTSLLNTPVDGDSILGSQISDGYKKNKLSTDIDLATRKQSPPTHDNGSISQNSRNYSPTKSDKISNPDYQQSNVEQFSSSESKNNKTKRRPSRRKLPDEPKTDSTSTITSLDRAKQSSQATSNKIPIKRQISQESLLLLQRRFGSESDVSTAQVTNNGTRTDRPFQLSKKKGQSSANKTTDKSELTKNVNTSFGQKSRKTSESGVRQKSSSLTRNGSTQRSSINKSHSANDVTQHNKTTSNSLKTDKQAKSAAKDVKSLIKTSSNGLSRNGSKTRHTSKPELAQKDSSNGPNNNFTSKTRPSLTRQDSATESISSIDSVTLKARPPSGFERTRSSRARRRQKISEKLESLETSYSSLERSPKKTGTASRKGSASSSTSIASSSSSSRTTISSETSDLEMTTLPKCNSTKRNSLFKRHSSQDLEIHDVAKAHPPAVRGRSLSASAKRTPSSSSVGHQKKEYSAEEEKIRLSSNSLKDKPTKSLQLSKEGTSQSLKHTSDFGNARGSTKTKHRKLPSTSSVAAPIKAHSNDKEKALEGSSVNDVVDITYDRRMKATSDLNDSFDCITVSQSTNLENAPHFNSNDDFPKNDISKDLNDAKIADMPLQENGLEDDPEKDDLKIELKLENTGSWMVLDYESTNTTPVSTRKNSRTEKDQGSFINITKEIVCEDMDIVNSNGTANGVFAHEEDQNKHDRHFTGAKDFVPVSPNSSVYSSTISDDTDSFASDLKDIPVQLDNFLPNGVAVQDEQFQGGEIVRRNALRKKKGIKSDAKKGRSRATKDLTNDVKAAPLVGEQHSVKSSTIERPSMETKNKTNLQLGLGRKKISGSCPDINRTVEPLSPVITNTANTPPTTLATKSGEKKKISPLKLLQKRRKLPETQPVKNA